MSDHPLQRRPPFSIALTPSDALSSVARAIRVHHQAKRACLEIDLALHEVEAAAQAIERTLAHGTRLAVTILDAMDHTEDEATLHRLVDALEVLDRSERAKIASILSQGRIAQILLEE